MGMYSYFAHQYGLVVNPNISVNEEKLRELSEELVEVRPANSWDYIRNDNIDKNTAQILDFSGYDDLKLYGYFYDNTKALFDYVTEICVLDDNNDTNLLEYHYEEGFDFRIIFKILADGRKAWTVVEAEQVWPEPSFDLRL